MLNSDERRRLAEIGLVVQLTDPRLANSLRRFRPPLNLWWATAVAMGGGWLTDLILLSTGHFIIATFLLVPLTAATAICWAIRRR